MQPSGHNKQSNSNAKFWIINNSISISIICNSECQTSAYLKRVAEAALAGLKHLLMRLVLIQKITFKKLFLKISIDNLEHLSVRTLWSAFNHLMICFPQFCCLINQVPCLPIDLFSPTFAKTPFDYIKISGISISLWFTRRDWKNKFTPEWLTFFLEPLKLAQSSELSGDTGNCFSIHGHSSPIVVVQPWF